MGRVVDHFAADVGEIAAALLERPRVLVAIGPGGNLVLRDPDTTYRGPRVLEVGTYRRDVRLCDLMDDLLTARVAAPQQAIGGQDRPG